MHEESHLSINIIRTEFNLSLYHLIKLLHLNPSSIYTHKDREEDILCGIVVLFNKQISYYISPRIKKLLAQTQIFSKKILSHMKKEKRRKNICGFEKTKIIKLSHLPAWIQRRAGFSQHFALDSISLHWIHNPWDHHQEHEELRYILCHLGKLREE